MAAVNCVDGALLTVRPDAVLDRDGVPYEVTLCLLVDGEPFGEVGERCGYFLASTAARLRAAREAGQQFPPSSLEGGLRAWLVDAGSDVTWEELSRYLPRDRELFSFRARDPDDLTSVGELRTTLQLEKQWTARGWQLQHRALVEAWGEAGRGVRAVLDSDQLLLFLETLVQEFAEVGASYEAGEDASRLRRPVG
jgi:hypothetical protein